MSDLLQAGCPSCHSANSSSCPVAQYSRPHLYITYLLQCSKHTRQLREVLYDVDEGGVE